MSVESPPLIDQHSVLLQGAWAECVRGVLSQVGESAAKVEVETAEEASAAEPAAEKAEVWAILTVSKALAGEMAILATEPGAVQLAQLLTSEPPDATAAFDATRREAFDELIRVVTGQVATTLKGAAGGDVDIKLTGNQAPAWPKPPRLGIRITGEKLTTIHLGLFVSAELAGSFRAPQETPGPSAPSQAETHEQRPEARAPQSESSGAQNSNLELLLDVTLDATICFGQKQMLLRDILDLHPGAAVVLDRHVEEPVDLLVGGRMVARGEVVIVDGNYGLRITEIVSPQQRIAFLAK